MIPSVDDIVNWAESYLRNRIVFNESQIKEFKAQIEELEKSNAEMKVLLDKRELEKNEFNS